MITAKIVADSLSPDNVRLTSMVLTYPRLIHSEVMTHRVFSRNAASSRAIPFKRMVEMLIENPAMPVKWGTSQKGMQSGPENSDPQWRVDVQDEWLLAMQDAINHARKLDGMGIHKSISNRLLEPFAHMTTIVTSTEWGNFFALRAHPDAQPEFQELAYKMLDAYLDNIPLHTGYGEWHLPFVTAEELAQHTEWWNAVKICVARCARISYVNFEESTFEKDVALHDRLMQSGHWSPFEHAATPIEISEVSLQDCWSGNFFGWRQYRKRFPAEDREHTDLQKIRSQRGSQISA